MDDRPNEEAKTLGQHRTKKKTAISARKQYIQRREQRRIFSLFGTIEYEESYDYKRERRSNRW